MTPLLIQRRSSAIEIVGRWFALAVGLSAATVAINVRVADVLALRMTAQDFYEAYLVWSMTFVGTAITVFILAFVPRWLPRARWQRWPLLAATVAVASWIGWIATEPLTEICGCTEPDELRATLLSLVVLATFVAVLAEHRHSFVRAAERVHRAEVERLRLQGELAAGRLQLLQAQIEPHFLFNSLANVRRLLRTEGAAGRAMLSDLLRYLESALPRLRDDRPTLEREIEVVRAFLGIHQVRMGLRLQFDFDVPKSLGKRVVPPMMLLTLVENALKHGLQPMLEGGSIRIAASSDPTMLRVHVADTGRGFGASLGAGTGLANIRARLRSMYGAGAQLTLRVNEPRGVVAMIELPLASS